MTGLELTLFALAVGGNAVGGALAVLGRGPPRLWRALLAAAAGALLILAGDRWVRSGHPPIMGTYEAAVADALVLGLGAVAWAWRRPARVRLATALGLPAAALLAHGATFALAPVPLTISERSLWVDVHALVAYLALALYLSSAAASIARLAVPDAATDRAAPLDEAQHSLAAVGYFFHTALILSGAWYSVHVFGAFWRWDPVETLAAISWVAYGLALHARLFFRWRGRKLAAAMLLCLVTVLALYKGVPYLGHLTFHVFDLHFGAPPAL